MPTLNTVFKQIFSEALEPLGFIKIKGEHLYLVRLIGNEIVHVIICINRPMRFAGYKAFAILGALLLCIGSA